MSPSNHTTRDVELIEVRETSLDAITSEDFRRTVMPLLGDARKVVLDLSRLLFVDSSGLDAILHCLRRLNASGGELRLCGLTPPVRASFELIGLDCVIGCYETREEAVASF